MQHRKRDYSTLPSLLVGCSLPAKAPWTPSQPRQRAEGCLNSGHFETRKITTSPLIEASVGRLRRSLCLGASPLCLIGSAYHLSCHTPLAESLT